MYWIAGVVAAGALVATGFLFGSGQRRTPGDQADLTTIAAGDIDQRVAATMGTMEDLRSLSQAWNENQLEWGVAFQDPDVSLEEFARVSDETLQSQAAVVTAIRVALRELPSAELQTAFQPIVDHYQARYDALRPLISASNSGTESEFQTALAGYLELVDPEGVVRQLRSVFEHPAVMELILHDASNQGIEGDPQEIIDAFLETFTGEG